MKNKIQVVMVLGTFLLGISTASAQQVRPNWFLKSESVKKKVESAHTKPLGEVVIDEYYSTQVSGAPLKIAFGSNADSERRFAYPTLHEYIAHPDQLANTSFLISFSLRDPATKQDDDCHDLNAQLVVQLSGPMGRSPVIFRQPSNTPGEFGGCSVHLKIESSEIQAAFQSYGRNPRADSNSYVTAQIELSAMNRSFHWRDRQTVQFTLQNGDSEQTHMISDRSGRSVGPGEYFVE